MIKRSFDEDYLGIWPEKAHLEPKETCCAAATIIDSRYYLLGDKAFSNVLLNLILIKGLEVHTSAIP